MSEDEELAAFEIDKDMFDGVSVIFKEIGPQVSAAIFLSAFEAMAKHADGGDSEELHESFYAIAKFLHGAAKRHSSKVRALLS